MSAVYTSDMAFTVIGYRTPQEFAQNPYGIEAGGRLNPDIKGYGIGFTLEYKPDPHVHLFFDGYEYNSKVLVVPKNDYGNSGWVYENSGWNSPYIGPFSDDCYLHMQSTGLRLGVKCLPFGNMAKVQPWIGIGYGIYVSKNSYATKNADAFWGKSKGYSRGLTYLCGIDFVLLPNLLTFTLFGDIGSPAADDKFENLFQTGWTYESNADNHAIGWYRFGAGFSSGF
jgi:hypothetical protein